MKAMTLLVYIATVTTVSHAATVENQADSSTEGRLAFTAAGNVQAGDIIDSSKLYSILYANTKCDLPIANADNLWHAEELYGNKLVDACWGMPLSPLRDKFVSVNKFGNVSHGSIYGYKKVRILINGSARVIGPAISDDEYQKRVAAYQKEVR
ncbi:hypothetical protein [Burkholderia gladioli]|uniref:hypothetical protein n=1 Tax=Burkholderia gladioli TaxID=28095 RepID=UPI00163EDF03|nr:hypothetical protein [Burkholderia gladioli]